MLNDSRRQCGNTPKVPGSRPGRPTKALVKGFEFNSVGSNVALDLSRYQTKSGVDPLHLHRKIEFVNID